MATHTRQTHGNPDSYLTHVKQAYELLRPDFGDVWVIAIFAVVVGVLSLATPLAVEALVNSVAFGRYLQPIAVLSVILFAFLAFAAFLRQAQILIAEVLQRRVFVRVVARLATLLPRATHGSFDMVHGPELLNRFFEVITLQKTVASLVLDGIAIIVTTLVGMTVLAFYHPWLLGFDIAMIVVMVFTIFVLGSGGVRTSIQESAAKYGVAAWLQQVADTHVVLKHRGGAEYCLHRADDLTVEYVEARRNHFKVLLRQISFALFTQAVAGTALLGLGGWLVINGQLTLGQLVAAELIVGVVLGAFAKAGKHLESWFDLMTSVDKLSHLFDIETERTGGEPLATSTRGIAVHIQRASYAFHGSHSFPSPVETRIEPNQYVVVSGPAGSGKSVLMDMLFGLRDPAQGHIELDGVDIRSLHRADLREHVALVRQGEILQGTVTENIRMGNPELNTGELRTALETVGLYEDVMALPQGCETVLAPHGSPLTGTQVVRLTLARAIAKSPRLLLIDGTLDFLPDEMAQAILGAIRRALTECTVILVTGRRELMDACDRTITLSPQHDHAGHPTNGQIGTSSHH